MQEQEEEEVQEEQEQEQEQGQQKNNMCAALCYDQGLAAAVAGRLAVEGEVDALVAARFAAEEKALGKTLPLPD